MTVSCLIATPGLDAASTPVPGCPSGSRTVSRPRFAAIRSRPAGPGASARPRRNRRAPGRAADRSARSWPGAARSAPGTRRAGRGTARGGAAPGGLGGEEDRLVLGIRHVTASQPCVNWPAPIGDGLGRPGRYRREFCPRISTPIPGPSTASECRARSAPPASANCGQLGAAGSIPSPMSQQYARTVPGSGITNCRAARHAVVAGTWVSEILAALPGLIPLLDRCLDIPTVHRSSIRRTLGNVRALPSVRGFVCRCASTGYSPR